MNKAQNNPVRDFLRDMVQEFFDGPLYSSNNYYTTFDLVDENVAKDLPAVMSERDVRFHVKKLLPIVFSDPQKIILGRQAWFVGSTILQMPNPQLREMIGACHQLAQQAAPWITRRLIEDNGTQRFFTLGEIADFSLGRLYNAHRPAPAVQQIATSTVPPPGQTPRL